MLIILWQPQKGKVSDSTELLRVIYSSFEFLFSHGHAHSESTAGPPGPDIRFTPKLNLHADADLELWIAGIPHTKKACTDRVPSKSKVGTMYVLVVIQWEVRIMYGVALGYSVDKQNMPIAVPLKHVWEGLSANRVTSKLPTMRNKKKSTWGILCASGRDQVRKMEQGNGSEYKK